MKKTLLIITIMFSAYVGHAQWTSQNVPLAYQGYLDAVKVVDANTVWGTTINAGGTTSVDTKDFARTIDGGTTWTVGTITVSPAGLRTANIYPIDAQTCFAAMYNPTAAGGKVYKTTNGGTSWTQVGANMFTAPTSFADVVYFWDAQNGMALGDPAGSPLQYEIYLTNDSGVTWTQVPGANLPLLSDPAEYGITNLYDAVDGHVWFGTTYGDIYRSVDNGNTWTKSFTGLPPYVTTSGGRQDISVIAFTDSLNGIVIQLNATGAVVVNTTDGGLTWTTITPTGNFYPADVTGVPGTNILVGAGSNATFGFGTSYSTDNGLTWTGLDTNVSHTSVDFTDMNTGYGGEFIALGAAGGAWKFSGVLGTVACGSPLITPGVGSMNDSIICFNDTVVFTVTGAFPSTEGATHGFSVIVSSGDLGQSNDPLNQPGILGGTGVNPFPANPFITSLPNDGAIFPAGIYYFTPVVYGNASGSGNITQVTLDPACTYTGLSVMVNLLADGDPLCTAAINELSSSTYSLNGYFNNDQQIEMDINSPFSGNTSLSVYDITGRNIFNTGIFINQGVNHEVIKIGDVGAGTYFIKIVTGTSQATAKVIKL